MLYSQMTKEQLLKEKEKLLGDYAEFKSLGLKFDMSRGKPSKAQLDLSDDLLTMVSKGNAVTENGFECRNYGGLDGIPEMKAIFADLFECPPEDVIIGENSSLHMMFDIIAQAVSRGLDGEKPWLMQGKVKFLCPCPGYDRHFAITEYFGIENIPVPMTENGPDMNIVEELIKDPLVKGIWCVPKYSNPDGYSYSDETIIRLASMKPAAPDFRIMYDNAYAVHHLYDDRQDNVLCLYKECIKRGTENRVLYFMSTSKITHPGSGVSALCASHHNIQLMKYRMQFQTIGPDKINQLRHVRYLKNTENIKEIMRKHADIMRPKFEAVLDEFENTLKPVGVGRWTNPNGGYFISFYAPEGCAKRTVELCLEAGLVTTPAGSAYPYGKDPKDSHIRIAPSFPPLDELKQAVKLFSICARLAALEKLL
ncbi:MAG: aminotransferase [Acutalibacteraceae bacterium]|nr:aminotransferase [Acutalibacteraceae bacterium]